jgi:hypothetical protein
LIAQNGWYVTYDIRLAQSEYTFIQQNGYYNGNTQAAAEKANGQIAGSRGTARDLRRPCRRWRSSAHWR